MDAATISALSGAPATVLLGYVIFHLLRGERAARKDFLTALAEERAAIGEVAKALRALQGSIDRQAGIFFGTILACIPPAIAERARSAAEALKNPPEA